MIELKKTLSDIVKTIVDYPDEITILETESGNEIILELHIAPSDMGKVIGRHGKIAKAIRSVMKAAANSIGKKVSVEIKD